MADLAPPAAGVQNLTPREIMTLTAVAGLMGDVPNIDYEALAPLIGQKYSKNARANVKKLFEKLRATNPGSDKGEKPSTPVNSDGEEGDVRKKTPARKAATPRKTVGSRATPKKSTSEKRAATLRKSKAKVKEDTKEEANDHAKDEDEAESPVAKADIMDEDE